MTNDMITEDYISFETAKLLKEKGFDEKCRTYYKVFPKSKIAAIYHSSENRGVSEDDPNEILCPTIHMAMKWLREVHHLFIQIEYECEDCFVSDIYSMIDYDEWGEHKHYPPTFVNCKTYEQACEAAVKHCIEKLI